MNTKRTVGFALALVAAALGVALLVGFHPSGMTVYGTLMLLGGAVTYAYPVAGATAPTAAQSASQSVVTATAVMADGDTSLVVTHNWNLTTGQLAALFPFIQMRMTATGTAIPAILLTATDSSNVTISKAGTAGTAFTGVIVIQRPHSIVAQHA